MKPALSASWTAYSAGLGLTPKEDREQLLRAVKFAAARLLQSAFEAAQMAVGLSGAFVLHLQLSFNMLSDPEGAATRLLGLPLMPAGV